MITFTIETMFTITTSNNLQITIIKKKERNKNYQSRKFAQLIRLGLTLEIVPSGVAICRNRNRDGTAEK